MSTLYMINNILKFYLLPFLPGKLLPGSNFLSPLREVMLNLMIKALHNRLSLRDDTFLNGAGEWTTFFLVLS